MQNRLKESKKIQDKRKIMTYMKNCFDENASSISSDDDKQVMRGKQMQNTGMAQDLALIRIL